MITIRKGVFETNSSSVHSLSILNAEEFRNWENGGYLYGDVVYNFEEAKKRLIEKINCSNCREENFKSWSQKEWEESLNEWGFETVDKYNERVTYDYETFERSFTTPSGDKMIAFGYYGNG